MKNQHNSARTTVNEVRALFDHPETPISECFDAALEYHLASGASPGDAPIKDIQVIFDWWEEDGQPGGTEDGWKAAVNRYYGAKPKPVSNLPKQPYSTAAAKAAQEDARKRLPVEYAVAAHGTLATTGKRFLNHNLLTLAHAFAYADLGLYAIDGHAVDGKGEPTDFGKTGKVPRGARWEQRASTSPDAITAFWTGNGKYPKNKEGKAYRYADVTAVRNVNIVFPADCGLFVLDIDGEEGKKALAALESEHGPLPKTWKSETGSGGLHLIFKAEGVDIRKTASQIAEGVDIRGKNGQIVAPPSIHPNGQFYRWADGCAPWERGAAEAPDWLRDLSYKATKGRDDKPKAKKSNKKKKPASVSSTTRSNSKTGEGWEAHLEDIGDGEGQKGFDAPINAAACAYFGTYGSDAYEGPLHEALRGAISEAQRDPKKSRKRYDTVEYLDERIENAREYIAETEDEYPWGTPNPSMNVADPLGESMDDAFATLDNRFVYVNQAGKTAYVRRMNPERQTDQILEVWKPSDFVTYHSDRPVWEEHEDKDGNAETIRVEPAREWIKYAPRYSGVTFAPSPLYAHANDFNMWSEFRPPKGDPSVGCHLFLSFLKEIICAGREDLYNWLLLYLAHSVQFPGEKPGTALVLQGDGGSGKSTFGELMQEFFGPFAVHASNPEHVTGKFNKHQATAIMMISDEALYGGDPKISAIIKDMVTGKTQRIEPKFLDSFEVPSCLRCIFIGNPKKVIPIEANGSDRRYLCMTVSNAHRNEMDYFLALREEASAGGLRAFYDMMQAFDPVDVGLNWHDVRTAPETTERRMMRGLSLRPVQRRMVEIVENGHLDAREESGRVVRYIFNEDRDTLVKKEHARLALRTIANPKDSRDSVGEVLEELFGKDTVTDTRRTVNFCVLDIDGEIETEGGSDRTTPKEHEEAQARCYVFPPLRDLRAILDGRFGDGISGDAEED